jgi:DNA-binding CsgD family transcriptional regulator
LLDADLARETYLVALYAAIHADGLCRDSRVVQVALAARGAPPAPEPPRTVDLLLEGLVALFADGYAVAVPLLKQALRNLEGEKEIRWLAIGSGIASFLWDDGMARALATRQRELAFPAGALTALQWSLLMLAPYSVYAGDFAAAADLIEQAGVITTRPFVPDMSAPLMLAAFGGREAEASQLIETTIEDASIRGEGRVIALGQEMTAVLHNSLGNYRQALIAAQHASDRDQLGVSDRALAELVEAAVHCGQPEIGAAALQRLSERTRLCETDWALGVEARSRALLSQGDIAERLYRIAIERLGRCSIVTDLARSHLVYGEWLRRDGRRMEARDQLRLALEMFTAMGAQAFAERTERELQATGERLHKRGIESDMQLTFQEAQISRLARAGHSNPEIAGKLYISPRTVEYHLRKVFRKLGISSRNQLHRVLDSDDV